MSLRIFPIIGVLLALVLFFVGIVSVDAETPSPTPPTTIELLEPFPDGDPIDLKAPAGGGTCGAICIIEQVVGKVYIFGTGLVAVVAVLWIIVGGYEIMFSGALGSAEASAGKEKITQALLGLVLVFMAALIMHTINPGFFTLSPDTAEPAPAVSAPAP